MMFNVINNSYFEITQFQLLALFLFSYQLILWFDFLNSGLKKLYLTERQ